MTFEPDGYEATKKDVAGNQLNYAMQMNVASDPLHMKMTTLAHYRVLSFVRWNKNHLGNQNACLTCILLVKIAMPFV
ncbi:MAG: hypothetical protein ACLRX9_00645 [Streptococcus salivarius]